MKKNTSMLSAFVLSAALIPLAQASILPEVTNGGMRILSDITTASPGLSYKWISPAPSMLPLQETAKTTETDIFLEAVPWAASGIAGQLTVDNCQFQYNINNFTDQEETFQITETFNVAGLPGGQVQRQLSVAVSPHGMGQAGSILQVQGIFQNPGVYTTTANITVTGSQYATKTGYGSIYITKKTG